jgi:dihydrofolate synthase/folylpolyglutamate synthase
MKTLVAKLQATYPSQPKRFIVGFSADKDISEIGNLLLSVVPDPSHIHLVEAVNLRAAKLEEIFCSVPQLKDANSLVKDRSITAQVKCARELADSRGEVLVVCGSVFLMSEARQALGVEEARDSDNITKVAGKGLMKCKETLMASKSSDKDP